MNENEALRWVEAWTAGGQRRSVVLSYASGRWTVTLEDSVAHPGGPFCEVDGPVLTHVLVDLRTLLEDPHRNPVQ